MITIKHLLNVKGDKVWSIGPKAMVYDALQMMAEKNVGALLVMEHERVVGILSERDYARKLILKGKSSRETPVEALMTRDVLYMTPTDTVNDCMALMTNKRLRHMPVMDNGKPVGLVSIGDVVKEIISEQEYTIHQLENYISGNY